MTEKVPPQNIEAEQSLIGSMLIDKDAVIAVSGWLMPEHFYEERNGIIYANILELFNEALPIDLITLSDLLKKKQQLTKIGGRTYLADLVAMVPTSAHAEEYGGIVKESATRRGLIGASRDITELAFNESIKIDKVMDESEKRIFDVAQSGIKSNFVHIKDLLKEAFERAERADNDEAYLGISTGFKDLDELLGGFQKSDLVILAARPSVGKTSLALDMMRHAAMVEKKTVVFFSLEMSQTQIMDRLIGMQSGIPFWEIRTGRLTDKKLMKLADTMGEFGDTNIYIDDQAGQHINSIRTKARRLKLEHGLDIIFVDYLQLMHGSSTESRTLEVSEISQGLKNIAKELDVPVIALSQLNRAIEQRQGRKPQLSDLRESGSIEQDADVVMFIDREETWNPDTENKGTGDLSIAKHRNGPTGNVRLAFVQEIASFRNLYKGDK
ncbi:MAG: replicative DNA helicase, replicative DNA helicase [candidate division WS6 bacterium GW2011_GWC1_36_11]|uniref:Replicative DNA helicase n=3 Tax=Candidatus Dojkabacteria TaxID=74243 RepID=A0A0G0DSS9_9BACT|nr:MAG: replicative DNA helicase, replicative DNA helicase [candidate division WS6 bacterium GW2011_GWC1_36_11]KKQ03420.1 MAG: Replicative DNA helicase [candidate division WS6 bacterium GW2011_WS6_36_26]KKQ12112.1 MAG: Replicative DNA helicase [candidate division WS6 bacterium GW2011_GWC2_36_7]KKQ17539.1 MAG: Replicative DNA helicase [candidate division WS6 bacterium GW2011_GWF1_36_8]HAM96879.1 replicative DNA helicase [Patescibacteria group bacterium]